MSAVPSDATECQPVATAPIGTEPVATSPNWWLDPAIAKLAFGAGSKRSDGRDSWGGDQRIDIDLEDPEQRTLGEFELLELIGQGGMGLVYRARQTRLQREVAVKLLSAGPWASPEFIARFQQEAQHAAQLQHPGIVTVFEMGELDGLVYYAMQLVRGDSLSQHLRRQGGKLPSRDAAALIRVVAEAVAYAHSLGVLHLDIKPGNILLEESGAPRVADFGLARRFDANSCLANNVVAGTPSYMAPEQAQLQGATLSPATDVWGLGAVLYELLTGQPPFVESDALATVKMMLHGTVRRPSRLVAVAADLEAVCLRCLQKGPALRYSSARDLADDLGRFLAGRAVVARPLNVVQRMGRWMRREPRLAVTSCIALLALIAGFGASVWLWQRAEHSASLAREVNKFLNEDVLAAADPYLELGKDPARITVATLLANAEAKLDRGLLNQPAARAQVGLTLGRAYFGMGLWSKARERLEKAHLDAQATLGHEADLTLDIEQQLGLTAAYDGHYAQAKAVYRHLLDVRSRVSGPNDPKTIAARIGHALMLCENEQFEQALRELESVRVDARLHAPEQLAEVEGKLSELYTETNDWDNAEALVRSALERSRRVAGPKHPQYLWESSALGDIHMMRARWDEAEKVFHAMHEGLQGTVGPLHPMTLTAVHYLGLVRLQRGQPELALPLLRHATRGRIQVHGSTHKYAQYSMNRVGEALTALRRPREARVVLEQALELATQSGRRNQAYVLLILDNLGRANLAVGDTVRALAYLDEALATARKSLPPNNVRRGMIERTVGELYVRTDEPRRARIHYQYAERVFAEGFGELHPWVVDLRARLRALDSPLSAVVPASQEPRSAKVTRR